MPLRLITFQAFVFFLVFVGLALFINPIDMWDGVSIEYASKIQNYAGIKSWFFESSWFLQYHLSVLVIEFAKMFNISFSSTHALFVLIFIFILIRETVLFAANKLNMKKSSVAFSSILVATFSVWHFLFSSVMLMHLACLALGILSIRWMHHKMLLKKLFGFISLTFVFHLNSLLVFLPVLSYFYDFLNKESNYPKWFVCPSWMTIITFLYGIVFYSFLRLLTSPDGLYEDYNSLLLTSSGLTQMLLSFVIMGTYITPTLILAGLILIVSLFSHKSPTKLINKEISNYLKLLLWLLVLYCAALFPYAAVGKHSALWDVEDWSGRQAILIAFPVSLFTTIFFQFLYDYFASKLVRNFILLCGLVILFLQLTLLSAGVIQKLNRQIFFTQLESLIHVNQNKLSPGLLEIVGNDLPTPRFRSYEANFLMHAATGNADWWTRIANNKSKTFTIPCYIKSNQKYQIKYIYDYKPEHEDFYTIIEINSIGFSGYLNAFRNVFGKEPTGYIEIEKIYLSPDYIRPSAQSCN